jgi:putative FmdB family regulatory protein
MKPKWSRLGGIVPTYQYVCTECGGQLETVQKFTDTALSVHEDCGGRLRKVFSPVGIVFKGSGFYRTDSRGSGPSGGSPSLGNDSPPKTSDSDAKSGSSAKAGGDSSASSSAAGTSSSGTSSSSGSSSSSSSSKASASSSSGEKVA